MKSSVLIFIIILLGFGLRVYSLGSLPAILNRDEAALAYNALLLQQTGQDEWGRRWPVTLESFGDFKLPGYSYTLVAFYSVLGVSDLVVRLPAALAGTWLLILSYATARKLKWSVADQILIVFLFATTPVFIFYSRMAWEAMLSLALMASSLYLLFFPTDKSLKRQLSDVLAVFLMLGAIFTYNIPFLLLPFLIPVIIVRREWRRMDTWGLPVSLLLGIFLISAFVFIPLTSQKSGITIFSDPTIYANWIEYRTTLSPLQQELVGSKYAYFGWLILRHGVESVMPQFLVLRGGSHPWHQVPGTAHVTWPIYLLGLIGLVHQVWQAVALLLQKKSLSKRNLTPYFWLYIFSVTLLPSLITVDSPHATRSMAFFSIWLFLTVKGWQWLRQELIAHKIPNIMASSLLVVSLGIFAVSYGHSYFVRYPTQQMALKPGLETALAEISNRYPAQPVAFVDPDGYHYILVAWYSQFSPELYFSSVVRQQPDRIGFRYGERVGDFHFIAHPDDRVPEEKVMLEWQIDQWQISER